jgi:hypothetical protein
MIFYYRLCLPIRLFDFYFFPRTKSFPLKHRQWTIKNCLKVVRSFWFRLMHHKSGWVARSLAKKKGKRV